MSWNLAKGEEFLPRISEEQLAELCKKEKSSKEKIRLLIALKRKQSSSIDDITNSLQMNRNTVYKTIRRFQERGIPAKEDEHRSGRPKKLSTKELKALKRELLKGPRKGKSPVWTTKQVQDLIRKKYHGNYVVRHVRRMLVDMGFSLQKPRPKHYKTDEKAQAHFKKTSGRSSESTGKKVSESFVWMSAQSQ